MKNQGVNTLVSIEVRVKNGRFHFAEESSKELKLSKQFTVESIDCFRDDILLATFSVFVNVDGLSSSPVFHVQPGIFDGWSKDGPLVAHGVCLYANKFQEGDLLVVKTAASTPAEIWAELTAT